jgi:hypothetical protein
MAPNSTAIPVDGSQVIPFPSYSTVVPNDNYSETLSWSEWRLNGRRGGAGKRMTVRKAPKTKIKTGAGVLFASRKSDVAGVVRILKGAPR